MSVLACARDPSITYASQDDIAVKLPLLYNALLQAKLANLFMINIDFRPGDVVRVHQKVQETVTTAGKTKKASTSEIKTRVQVFEGVVLGIKGEGENKSFMVRKKSYDHVSVERIWPLNSPSLVKIEVKSNPKRKIRRAKLYYLRKTEHA